MARLALALAALALLVWTASTSLTQVRSDERAVVRRFGRLLERKLDPGLYIGWPWGIDRVDREQVKVRTIKVGFADPADREEEVIPAGQMLTGDHNLVNVQAVIDFKMREEEIDKFVLHKDRVEAIVARAAETLLTEWTAGRTVHHVLARGKIELPQFLRVELQARVNDYDLGIEIEQVNINDVFPPEQVKEAFTNLTRAHNSIDTKIKEARLQANKLNKQASAKEYEINRLALAYARDEIVKSRAEADGFLKRLASYRKLAQENPEYLNALWVDGMTRLYTSMKEAGRIQVLDHFLSSEGISITEFPLQPRKK